MKFIFFPVDFMNKIMQMAVTLQNHSEVFKFPVFSKIFTFPVFSLSGFIFHNFPCFPYAVGTLNKKVKILQLVTTNMLFPDKK